MVNTSSGLIGERDLELRVGFAGQQLYVALSTEPPHVWVDKVGIYRVIISNEGYENLVRNGTIGDRMATNPACKVMIYRNKLH